MVANWDYYSYAADSLVYEIETENVYNYFEKNKEMLYFGNYSANSNALVVGEIKDQMGSVTIEEFVRL